MVLSMYFTRLWKRLCIGSYDEEKNDEEKKGIIIDLFDDCLLEILSRLPSYDVLTCRRVCKRLHTLTSSAHFIASQTNRAPAIILIHELGNVRQKIDKDKWYCSKLTLPDIHNNLFCLDDTKTNKKLKKLTLNGTSFTQYIPELLFSFGGLVAFKCQALLYFVLNPISGKSRRIPWPPNVPVMCFGAYMCGMFFHPLASEFKLIFVHKEYKKEYKKFYCWYYVYGSATNCWRRINTSPLFCWPTYNYDPVVVDMRLYWMVNLDEFAPIPNRSDDPCMHAVMVFDINSEEIHTMPHPMLDLCHINNFRDNHEMMILFEMDKKLWLAQLILQGGDGMDIWELNDHVNWSWVRRYNICKSEIPKWQFIKYSQTSNNLYTRRTKFFCINEGMLLINWCSAELYFLDLSRKTIRKIPDKYTSSNHRGFYLCGTYTCSLLIPNV